jgi:hypothetical protein
MGIHHNGESYGKGFYRVAEMKPPLDVYLLGAFLFTRCTSQNKTEGRI